MAEIMLAFGNLRIATDEATAAVLRLMPTLEEAYRYIEKSKRYQYYMKRCHRRR